MESQEALDLYRSMFRIRRFEETCHELYLSGKIPGMSPHLYIGEEAVAASVCFFLKKDDYIISTHRGHGHCLAKGARIDRMLAEIMVDGDAEEIITNLGIHPFLFSVFLVICNH